MTDGFHRVDARLLQDDVQSVRQRRYDFAFLPVVLNGRDVVIDGQPLTDAFPVQVEVRVRVSEFSLRNPRLLPLLRFLRRVQVLLQVVSVGGRLEAVVVVQVHRVGQHSFLELLVRRLRDLLSHFAAELLLYHFVEVALLKIV